MEKLGQLRRADEWDLIVVDTPPSRSALDFLDAPQRLARFLDGKLLRLLTAPAKVGGRAYLRVLNAGFGMVTGVLTKILGAQVLRDVQTFVSRAGHHVRRLPRAGRLHLSAAAGARHRVPGRRGARAGRAARGVVLRRAAGPGADAAGRADAEPGAALPAARLSAARQPGRGRRDAAGHGRGACRWPWPRCGCTPSGCSRCRRSDGWPSTSPPRIPSCPSPRYRRRPRMCMIWRACAPSGRHSAPKGPTGQSPDFVNQETDSYGQLVRTARLGGLRCRAARPGGTEQRQLATSSSPVRSYLFRASLEQFPPRRDVRAAAQQRAALTLGHPAPHAELDPVVEGVSEALGPDGAAPADQLGPVLRRPLNEELVRVRALARGAGSPVRDPHVAQLLLIVTPAAVDHAGWRSVAVRDRR